MDEVAPFVNLEQGGETDSYRLLALRNNLPLSAVLKTAQYGAADFAHYKGGGGKAQKLVDDNPNAKAFFASCWPTLEALNGTGTSKTIVYAGMVTANNAPANSTGIKAFDIDELCQNWPALLLQIAPAVRTATIVYDDSHNATKLQRDSINNNKGNIKNIKYIHADDGHGGLNNGIDSDINTKTASGEGLIVTACTMTGVLREKITKAARQKKLITIFPEEMYMKRTQRSCLITYGPNLLDLYKQVANTIIPQVIAGQLPAPITNHSYALYVNTTVAAELGLQIPDHFMVTVGGQTQVIHPNAFP
jgi:hypothetical protein